MTTEIRFGSGFHRRNPDVLTCIANLSSDEVFTPPAFANQMLDTLAEGWAASNAGENIWSKSDIKFLDPFTKSGVFLREITKRLSEGLEQEIPDLEERVDHILTKQVYGIGITGLTALLARRSLYCSKDATGKHSVATSFKNSDGNVWFEKTQHAWIGGKEKILIADENGKTIEDTADGNCKYCGASKKSIGRESELETHAYKFIHTSDIKSTIEEVFGQAMQFDVIIGNPPYQLNDGGGSGTSAAPIYQKFVDQARKLEPRFLSMVIQARWYAGGKGLDEFRASMLQDTKLREIHDYPDSNEVFPGTQIKGGICYFLWDRDNPGDCKVSNYLQQQLDSVQMRPLLEPGLDVFIRYNQGVDIVKKIMKIELGGNTDSLELPSEKRFSEIVSTRRPFGDIENRLNSSSSADIVVHRVGEPAKAKRKDITTGLEYLDAWKVFIPFLASGSDSFPHSILGRPFIGSPKSATTETNLVIGPLASKKEAINVLQYISTRFFRFLVLQRKPSQNATRKVYASVPMQDFAVSWTDEMLYEKYKLTASEIMFIESMIRPMELAND